MTITIDTDNRLDDNGNPAGGYAEAIVNGDHPAGGTVPSRALYIRWQDGPIGEHGENGVQIEHVLEACRDRLLFLNTASNGRFSCRENSLAITKVEEALHWLNARTARRQRQGTEGTHSGT
jgi:hypothetical protein